MNTFGENIQFSIFGESHGKLIGGSLSGLPAGTKIDTKNIEKEMKRRRPSEKESSTKRREEDKVHIVSGCLDGRSTGSPLTVLIENKDSRSNDYHKGLIRPGHADYPLWVKSQGFTDYRGGGHSSGRLTAVIVAIGSICKDILKDKGVFIESQITQIGQAKSIGGFRDTDEITEGMKEEIMKVKEEKDSIGGEIKVSVKGVPIGVGRPFFGSAESRISSMMFSIPAVKGVEFGDGFMMASLKGSQVNDALLYDTDEIKLETNHNGGINGGISNGNPIEFSVVIKPTPTIGKTQQSIDMIKEKNIKLSTEGRHDVCIVPRVKPVLEAATALTILDLIYD